jgi:23S rRNA pseudouridine2605 synthase
VSEKLQKVLARAGLGSRREIERWIVDGRLFIDDQIATTGDRIEGDERIKLDGRLLSLKLLKPQATRVIVYHKSMGSICSRSDPDYDKTVFDDFPKIGAGRWVLVGRLDINTTGLLLATTEGELANRLMHPKYEVTREYAVRIYGEVDQQMINVLLKGVELEDGVARFDSIVHQGGEGKNLWFTVTLHEGRNREVRRLWESQGVQVNRLVRNSFGPIRLPRRLKVGGWEELDDSQIKALYSTVKLVLSDDKSETGKRSSNKAPNKASRKSYKKSSKKASEKTSRKITTKAATKAATKATTKVAKSPASKSGKKTFEKTAKKTSGKSRSRVIQKGSKKKRV